MTTSAAADLEPIADAFTVYAERLARWGAMLAAAVAEHRATWKANREAVHARRIAQVQALVTLDRRRLDAMYVADVEADRIAGRRWFDLEAPLPPPLYVASLVRVPNAPPQSLNTSVPMGETT